MSEIHYIKNAINQKSTFDLSWTIVCFVPIGIETFGAWGQEGHKLVKEIGKKLKEVTGEPRSTFYLTQRISVAIQRGNSSCVQGTVPTTEGLDEIFEFVDHDN